MAGAVKDKTAGKFGKLDPVADLFNFDDIDGKGLDKTSEILRDISDRINSEDFDQPTIRPILDLSDVKDKARRIPGLLYGTSAQLAGRVGAGLNASRGYDPQGLAQGQASQTFIQNNYSPRALSRLEIYRQTRNQFAMMKGIKPRV